MKLVSRIRLGSLESDLAALGPRIDLSPQALTDLLEEKSLRGVTQVIKIQGTQAVASRNPD